jgi:predicted nuclease with TOPRIM domain
MNKEDVDFLISIQDLEQPDFDNACLERENTRLQQELQRKDNIINELKETIKELTDDSEDTTCYEITNTVKRLLLEELEENK